MKTKLKNQLIREMEGMGPVGQILAQMPSKLQKEMNQMTLDEAKEFMKVLIRSYERWRETFSKMDIQQVPHQYAIQELFGGNN
jgi:signal recognition particle GTPase